MQPEGLFFAFSIVKSTRRDYYLILILSYIGISAEAASFEKQFDFNLSFFLGVSIAATVTLKILIQECFKYIFFGKFTSYSSRRIVPKHSLFKRLLNKKNISLLFIFLSIFLLGVFNDRFSMIYRILEDCLQIGEILEYLQFITGMISMIAVAIFSAPTHLEQVSINSEYRRYFNTHLDVIKKGVKTN